MRKLFILMALTFTSILFTQSAIAARCTVELSRSNGRLLETFTGWGYDRQDACYEANQDCRDVVRSGRYRGRNLKCSYVQPRRDQDRDRRVTRSCSASMVTRGGAGRVVDTFFSEASGRRGNGIKRKACQRALRLCRVALRNSNRRRAICEVNR